MNQYKNLQRFEILEHIAISSDDDKECPKIVVTTKESTAEIYLHGAHVTSFQKKGEPPLFFVSDMMEGNHGKVIHGGIPICFPWFGNREGEKLTHGFARTTDWELIETSATLDGAVSLRLRLPSEVMVSSGWPPVTVMLAVTISKELTMELMVTNTTEHDFIYEDCFHPYFHVGDISQTTISGLEGCDYLDKTEDLVRKYEDSRQISITGETNRIYLQSTGELELNDSSLQRVIHIKKSNSDSTVVWNPWSQQSQKLPDLNAHDYQKFLCVESGNVAESAVTVAPGLTSSIKVTWTTENNN